MNREILPNNVKPNKYTLKLKPNFNDFVFDGVLDFSFDVLEKTNTIVLNSKELNIQKAKFLNNDVEIINIELDENLERVTFTLNKFLDENNYNLIIEYQGILNDQMAGFYKSKYLDTNNQEKYLAVTQFEAVDARRGLPCMDEPVHKAKFQISLVIPENLIGLSNTELIKEEKLDNNNKLLTFAETPIMSTYLLAFFVGEADYTTSYATIGNNKIPVRVFTPIGESEKGVFARDLCVKVLEFFSEYFDIDYPLNKMDMIAIPDFAAGAMENWGLITYRSKYILCDETTSLGAKTQLAYTICHELAHQWFGNLVTMSWWSELWLNEGFATWVGWMAVDNFFPEWKVWDTFYLDEFLRAQQLDSLHSSHPIEVPIKKASDVDEIFDAISYSKGACIIAMLVNYLGSELFQKGIIKYLKKFKYSNATTNDLWKALEESSKKKIIELVNNWTLKQGFPVINIESKKDSIKLKQSSFNSDVKNIWHIPLNINKDNNIINLVMKEESLEIHNFNSKWYKLNHQQKGFFIVNYDDKSLDKLKKQIYDKNIEVVDRAGIINDLYVLANFGYIKLHKALSFTSTYNTEDEYLVLSVIIDRLNHIKSIWYDNIQVIEKINQIIGNLIMTNLESLDYTPNKNEKYTNTLRRNLLISVSIELNIKKVIDKLNSYWKNKNLPANLRELIYRNAIKYGNIDNFKKLLSIYKETNSSLEQNQILNSLGYSQDINIIENLLNLTFEEDSIVRSQDIPFVIASVANNPISRKYLWEFVKNNWQKICDKLKGGSFLFGRVVSTSIKLLSSQKDLDDINKFISSKNKDLESLNKTIKQSIENITNRINLKERNLLNEFDIF